jgi:hypothetical protein
MRCSICDYSDDHPSILNDGLTDGNFPRTFKERKGDLICSTCDGHLVEVKRDWSMKDHDEKDHSSAFLLDRNWDT